MRVWPLSLLIALIPTAINSDQIVLGHGIRFGFGFTLTGSSAIPLIRRFRHFDPALRRTAETVFFPFVKCNIGANDCLVGFVVGDPKVLTAGVWTFQLYDGQKLLAEKRFAVSRS